MNGKSKCKILKDIRRQIAEQNDITYVTSECKYQGDCAGTCPKCESEVRYLENELEKRRKTGKKVVLAGIAAATIMGLAACGAENTATSENESATPSANSSSSSSTSSSGSENPEIGEVPDDELILEGDVALPPEDDDVLMGEPSVEYPGDDEELGGDPIWDDEELAGVPVEDPSDDQETEETLPPFVDEEPGVDTGNWGDLF